MLISLIVPVYHAEETLVTAIESFLLSPGDYEMVLVFDGEQEACYRLALPYAEKHPSIRLVYPHRRLGALGARLNGIKEAKGEYCCFLDADDALVEGTLNRYEALCNNGKIDIINTSFYTWDNHGLKPNAFTHRACVMNRDEAFKALLGDSYIRGFLWTKMIRRSLLEDPFVLVGEDALFEDTCLTAMAFARAKSFRYVPEPLYRYRKTSSSSAVRKPRLNRSSYHLAAFASIRLYLSKADPSLLPVFFRAKNRSYWSLWYDYTQDKKFGLPKSEVQRRKKEFKDIFNPKKELIVAGSSYEAMIDPILLP